MATKAKKHVHPMPKLGWPDQLLYWVGMVVTLSGSIFCVFFPLYYRSKLAFDDPRVFIFDEGKGTFHFIWLSVVLLVVFLYILEKLYKARIPVFGRKDIKYGPPAYPHIYPLLMKNKPKHWKSPREAARKKRNRIIAAVVLVIALIFSMIVYPRSLYGRYELYEDGTVVIYDTYNNAQRYTLKDMDSVSLEVIPHRQYWTVGFVFLFSNGETCKISIPKTEGEWTANILKAQQLKERYGSLLTIDTEDLWRVVLNRHLNAIEKDVLYALFEAN